VQGLRIKGYWDGDDGVCDFTPALHHRGCRSGFGRHHRDARRLSLMPPAMATAIRSENRPLSSEPRLRFATGHAPP